MRVVTEIGEHHNYLLAHALLIYRDREKNRDFATAHDVVHDPSETCPQLAPGRLLSTDFLQQLAAGLRLPDKAAVLPENVLAYTSELLVWWTRPIQHCLFFSDGAEDRAQINGRTCPHPALVWKVRNRSFYLRALAKPERPKANTELMVAPYWNTEPGAGRVCQGDMPRPDRTNLESMDQWERGFFVSRFTHPSGMGQLTSHPGKFIGLWKEMVDQPEFPAEYLLPARQTLQEFVEGE